MDAEYVSDDIEIIFQQELESTEDPPIDDWSSIDLNALNVHTKSKQRLYEKGLYDPGSGELCAKYIPFVDSYTLRHDYYSYPAIHDPGILRALLQPDLSNLVEYPDDGQKLYVTVCEEMNQCPVRMFYRGLLKREIDLRYYGVNPYGVRAMAIALSHNNVVTSFNLTDNFLNDDACYHLGDMLSKNRTILELNLSGCRIGPNGLKMFLENILRNVTLKKLDLSKNNLSNDGMIHLSNAIFKGLNVIDINLGRNNISGEGVASLTEAFEAHNKFTVWNLSWNKLFLPGTYNFLTSLTESTKNLKEMDLSWNNLYGPRVALGIKHLLNVPSLSNLNLSNNKLTGEAVEIISSNLKQATQLDTLNLSYNPLTTRDALQVLQKLKTPSVNMLNLYMDNVSVTPKFLQLLDEIKLTRPQLTVTYGDVIGNFVLNVKNIQQLILNRVEYLCKRSKRKLDFALIALQLQKENITRLSEKEFVSVIKEQFKAPLDDDLVDGIVDAFSVDPDCRIVDINLLVEHVRRIWPDRRLPPTPPAVEPDAESHLLSSNEGTKEQI